MDYIAIISDLHGNIPALEAVLRDIKRRHIQRARRRDTLKREVLVTCQC